MPQTWDAPFTPVQRWIFLQLALDADAAKITTGVEGKAFRRALRAFGLMPIRDALGRGNKISDELAQGRTPALFKITAENVEIALGWAKVPRHPSLEMDAGDAFDLLEQLRADPEGWTTPTDVPTYRPDSEDWRPAAPAPDAAELDAIDLLALLLDNDLPMVKGWGSAEWTRAREITGRTQARAASTP